MIIDMANATFYLGIKYYSKGKYLKAKKLFKAALALDSSLKQEIDLISGELTFLLDEQITLPN